MKTLILTLLSLLPVAAFAGDFSLRVLSDGTAEISAYTGMESSVVVPAEIDGKRISRIGEKAFFNNRELTSVTLPSGVTEISESAFALCSNLKRVTFPSSLKTIGESAFFFCHKLSSIELPNSLKYLGDEAFALCSSLEDVSAPILVKHIGENVFPLSSETLFPPSKFPRIEIEGDSKSLVEPSGNGIIDGNENCVLRITVKNSGNADAYGCRFRISLKEPNKALVFSPGFGITKIPADKSLAVTIPVSASIELEKGKAQFTFSLDEPRGLSARSRSLVAETGPFMAPKLEVVDSRVDGTPKRNELFELNLRLQNLASGTAENVRAEILLPSNVILVDSQKSVAWPKMPRGEVKDLKFKMLVPGSYSADTIPVEVKLSEKYGKYAKNFKTILCLQSDHIEDSIRVVGKSEGADSNNSVRKALFDSGVSEFGKSILENLRLRVSEVDKNIPENPSRSCDIYAVIIANEKYTSGVPTVDFAQNDGKIFRDYCIKTLGVPEKNVKYCANATVGKMYDALAFLKRKGKLENSELIFYYSGHGVSGETSNYAYLLPSDCSPNNTRHALSLESLYRELGATNAKFAAVFIDACFSGMNRNNMPLVPGKGLVEVKGEKARLVPVEKKPLPAEKIPSKVIVFSATDCEQTAHWLKEERHGLFTYVLLKKLQKSRGNISFAELKDYLLKEVRDLSIRHDLPNEQNPDICDNNFPYMDQKLYTPKTEEK